MMDPRQPQGLPPRRSEPGSAPLRPDWSALIDWLGAQTPRTLILGATVLMVAVAVLALPA